MLVALGLVAFDYARSAIEWQVHLAVPWLVVAALFFLVEATAFHIEIRRETHSLSLSALPLLLGLVSLQPAVLVASRLVGSGLALVAVRRRTGLKLVWNLALYTVETAVAAVVATWALRSGEPHSITAWLILLGAVLVAELIGLISVPTVIMIAENELRLSLFGQIGRSQLIAGFSATFGVVAVAAMLNLRWMAAFAIVPVAGVGFLLHLFGRLGKEHHDLVQLHDFTTAISGQDPLEAGLEQLTTILRASSAAIAVRSGHHTFAVISRSDHGGSEQTVQTTASRLVGQEVAAISATGAPSEPVELLQQLGGQTGLACPISDHTGDTGYLLLVDRLGASDQFRPDEVKLFGTLATNLASRVSASQLLNQLEIQARTDTLTGLANRSAIEVELDRLLADEAIEGGVVLMIDLDRFKDVNDSLGHHFGDALLQLLAERFRGHIRDGDMAGRLGGDEFAVLLPLAHDQSQDDDLDLERQLSSLAERLNAPVTLDDVALEISTSMGLALWPNDACTSAELLRLANIAMYEAKRTSQTWIRYDPSIDHASADRLALLGQIRDAITQRDLRIHLQPQIQSSDNSLVGAEALLRWHHAERGMISPGEFLPLAEQSSLAGPITRHVITEAAAAARTLRPDWPELTIWVNLAARDLLDETLAPTIAAAILQANIAPHQLGFEVTESSLIVNLDMAIATLAAIRQLGCATSVDDFGTGFASLQYIQRLPIDELKIDQSFIREVRANAESAAIVRATTRLAHDLGKSVVAEGVEDQATQDVLASIGCDILQGYHISRPLDLDTFVSWASTHRSLTRL